MSIVRYDPNSNSNRTPEEVNLLIASSLEFIQNYISNKGDKELKVPTDFYKQIMDCYRIWQRGGDNIVSSVLDMQVWSATNYGNTIYSKVKGDSETQDFLNYWKSNVNRGVAIDVPVGLDNVIKEWYIESWGSRLVTLYMIWGTMEYNGKNYQVPVQMYIPNTYGIGVIPSELFGGNKYFFRSKQDISQWDKISEDIYKDPTKYQSLISTNEVRKYIPLQTNHSAKVSKIGASNRTWEVFPTPYLYHKQTAALVKVKEAIRNSDYRTAIGIVNDLLLIKKGSEELTKRGITYGEPELTALNNLLKEKLAATGILGTSYDTTVEHVTPDVAAMLSKDKYSEIDTDIYASLGLISINIENERVRTSELNPKGLILEVAGCMKIFKDLMEKEIFYEIIKRNKGIFGDKKSEDYIFYQKPMNIWVSDEGKRLKRLLYDRGLISKRETIEVLGESDYDIQSVQRNSEEKDGEVFFPPVIQNVEKDVEPEGGRPQDTQKDDIKNKETDKKQNRKEVTKDTQNASEDAECPNCGEIFVYLDQPEAGMGYVKCPICKEPVTQNNLTNSNNYTEAPAKLDDCVESLMQDSDMISKYPDSKERKQHSWAICQHSVMHRGIFERDEKWSEFDKKMAEKLFIHKQNLAGYYKDKDGNWKKAEE